ncbi:hypothetical protein BLNAU_16857 [Blattamonas nauphoetae]|uniref:Uncharacterized protein n=1 Tax=Blattamonas nauphoetae TaxID=2049346 RepID=A0ABQ9X852_9EUKA|nr:hypothetical protein BLNAU_16857 [Blattamonas nauphoetae]
MACPLLLSAFSSSPSNICGRFQAIHFHDPETHQLVPVHCRSRSLLRPDPLASASASASPLTPLCVARAAGCSLEAQAMFSLKHFTQHCPNRLQLKLAETSLIPPLVITLNRLPLSFPDTRDITSSRSPSDTLSDTQLELQNEQICLLLSQPSESVFHPPTLAVVCALPVLPLFSNRVSTSESRLSISGVFSGPITMLLELNMNNGEPCASAKILLRKMRMKELEDTLE